MSIGKSLTRQLGRFRLHALSAGGQRLDGGAMFGVVPKPLWQKKMPADERNRVPLALRPLLVQADDELVLIDTGAGNKEDAKFRDMYGLENDGDPTALEDAIRDAGFDWRFLQSEFRRCRRGRLGGERVCTLRLARRLHPELPRRSLGVLADYYAIVVDSCHRAGSDARATAELFLRFLGRLADQGVVDWGRLQAYLRGEYPPELARQRTRKGTRSREELRH